MSSRRYEITRQMTVLVTAAVDAESLDEAVAAALRCEETDMEIVPESAAYLGNGRGGDITVSDPDSRREVIARAYALDCDITLAACSLCGADLKVNDLFISDGEDESRNYRHIHRSFCQTS